MWVTVSVQWLAIAALVTVVLVLSNRR